MEKPFPNVAAEYHFELLKARKKKLRKNVSASLLAPINFLKSY